MFLYPFLLKLDKAIKKSINKLTELDGIIRRGNDKINSNIWMSSIFRPYASLHCVHLRDATVEAQKDSTMITGIL